jgi:hypothetical protein
MSELVVVELEAIEIHYRDREGMPTATGQVDLVLDQLIPGPTIGERGEAVAVGLVVENLHAIEPVERSARIDAQQADGASNERRGSPRRL